jgi:hypothetical protein
MKKSAGRILLVVGGAIAGAVGTMVYFARQLMRAFLR